MRIVRAILSLLEAAVRDARTTHVLLCTESCVPVATLRDTARSVLLDEVRPWEEDRGEEEDGRRVVDDGRTTPPHPHGEARRVPCRLDWDRSYVNCYGRNSSRCTRFDERE